MLALNRCLTQEPSDDTHSVGHSAEGVLGSSSLHRSLEGEVGGEGGSSVNAGSSTSIAKAQVTAPEDSASTVRAAVTEESIDTVNQGSSTSEVTLTRAKGDEHEEEEFQNADDREGAGVYVTTIVWRVEEQM